MVIENKKTLENSIDSIKIRLIWLIENQSNDYIRLNLIESTANQTWIAFDWLRMDLLIWYWQRVEARALVFYANVQGKEKVRTKNTKTIF